jgi:nucleotide-binding universal stress UspA family protein
VGDTLFELGTDGPTRVLVGIDGSDTSMRAGAYAAGMARREGAQLIVVYVMTAVPAIASVPESTAALITTQREFCEQLRAAIDEAADRVGIDVELLLRTGNPYRELVRVAGERRVDAVVVGASSQAGHRIVGSLAGRLVRDAAWPITVVP